MRTNSITISLVTASVAFSLFGALSAANSSGFNQFIELGDSTLGLVVINEALWQVK